MCFELADTQFIVKEGGHRVVTLPIEWYFNGFQKSANYVHQEMGFFLRDFEALQPKKKKLC